MFKASPESAERRKEVLSPRKCLNAEERREASRPSNIRKAKRKEKEKKCISRKLMRVSQGNETCLSWI